MPHPQQPRGHIFWQSHVLHRHHTYGHKDPQVSPDQAVLIENELDAAGVDWQLMFYGSAMHSFTDPNATEIERGRKYDPVIAKRSWYVMEGFLKEVLS